MHYALMQLVKSFHFIVPLLRAMQNFGWVTSGQATTVWVHSFWGLYEVQRHIFICVVKLLQHVIPTKCQIAAVWPDVKIKSSPNFSRSCPKSSNTSLCLKSSLVFIISHQKSPNVWGTCEKNCRKELSKINVGPIL